MTVRSVIIGLLVGLTLAGLGYVNDVWLFLSYIGGDLVPIHAFGLLLIGVLAVNPVLRLLRTSFRPGEWVTMLSLVLMGSVIAGSGLLWTFPHPIITPIQEQAGNPGWTDRNLLQYVPDVMMVQAPAGSDVVRDYYKGVGAGRDFNLLKDVPWHAWRTPLAFWFVVLALCFVGSLCAVIIVHRQWSQREHLSYPIVTFANELVSLDRDNPDRAYNPLFRQAPFWLGFGLAFVVLAVNGYTKSYNANFITIPTGIDFRPFQELSILKPIIKVPLGNPLLNFQFFFAAVGLAYFLTNEASFSLGISSWLYAIIAAPLFAAGLNLQTSTFAGGLPAYMYFGAYVGMGVMTVYLGRRFYWAVIKKSVWVSDRQTPVMSREAWALRILLLTGLALVLLLVRIGLHWSLAVLFVMLAGLLFLMVARVNVATGLFLIQPQWHPVDIVAGLFGGLAVGPQALMILGMLCTVVTIDPRIAVAPLAANALKLGEAQGVRTGRLSGWMGVAVVAAMVVGVVATVGLLYYKGVTQMPGGGTSWGLTVAKFPFQMLDRNLTELISKDQLAQAVEPVTLSRLWSLRNSAEHMGWAILVGLGLVLVCSFLRLRFPRWPLHPVMFLVWGTPWMTTYAPSFLLAWLLKSAIMKYGGQSYYHRARGFFIGLVAGEFGAAILWAAVGLIYFLVTNRIPKTFLVRP